MSERSQFKVGDKVRWTSQAGGHARTKEGEVIAVVPAGTWIGRAHGPGAKYIEPEKLGDFVVHGSGFGMHRDHESYLIAVLGKTPRRKPRLYWPQAKALRPVDEPKTASAAHA